MSEMAQFKQYVQHELEYRISQINMEKVEGEENKSDSDIKEAGDENNDPVKIAQITFAFYN